VSLRLAMLGMIPGNGHPWSWSAIIAGRRSREQRTVTIASVLEELNL